MATLQLIPSTATINGATTTYTQLILTPVSPKRIQSKTILPKQEPVSPVTSLDTCTGHTVKLECPKRRIHFSKKALTHPRPQSVTRRNTRERNRIKAVNQGFVTLANHVPSHLRSKKMSKVDTLKSAIDYIRHLQEALDTNTDLSESLSESSSDESNYSLTSENSDSISVAPSPVSSDEHIASDHNIHNIEYPNYVPHTIQQSLSGYQPQCTQFYATPQMTQGGYNVDYTRPLHHIDNNCPSPTDSYVSSDTLQQLSTAEAEAEILEFASSWLY